MTLEPDGAATGCGHRRAALVRFKWVRLPGSVSDYPTAGSGYILLGKKSEPFLRWMVLIRAQLPVGTTSPPC